MARCQGYKSSPLVVEESATTNQQRAGACLDNGREGCIEFVLASSLHDQQVSSNDASRRPRFLQLDLELDVVWIEERSYCGGLRNRLVQEAQPFGHQVTTTNIADARDFAPGPVQTGHQSCSDGVGTAHKHNRRRRGCVLGRSGGSIVNDNHGHLTPHKVGRQTRQSIQSTLRAAIIDRVVLILEIPEFVQTLAKCENGFAPRFESISIEQPNQRHCRLLPARRERPRRRRAADQRDKLTASHSITSSASASNLSGISRPSALAVLTLITSSNFVGSTTGRSPGLSPLRMRPA